MKLKILGYLLLICLIPACNQISFKHDKPLEIVDIKSAFEKKKPININDISKDCKYVVLESTNESLIGNNFTIYSDDEYLIAIDRQRILLFDRNSGKFIRKIGNSGNGPDEYSNPYSKIPYDEEKKVINAARNRERYEYTLTGVLINKKKGPELASDFVNIDENTYASFIENYMGDEKKKIIIFNKEDSIIKIFPNYLSFPFKDRIDILFYNSWFYKLNKQLYFCERFNDTLFNITSNSLNPRFVFDKGLYSFPYELRSSSVWNKYFLTENILESTKYLFYTFGFEGKIYTAMYDKEKKTTIVNDYIEESGNGYINNINDFVPLELSSINDEGELTCTMDAYKIRLWFEKNSDKFEKLPNDFQKLKKISESDNPIVVIVRLKE
jgi:hypothetical protein